jgi:hypothetical protein
MICLGKYATESQVVMQQSIVGALPTFENDSGDDWVTAKVIVAGRARRIVNRLDVLGFDYKVVQENHHLRILVRRRTLEDVLCWIDGLSCRPQMTDASRPSDYPGIYLLIAIPIGILAGAIGSRLLGIESPASYAIAGYAGLAAIGLSILASSRFAKRR